MKTLKIVALLVLLAALCSPLALPLRADDWTKLTRVTFSAPVEIPGQVLPAGMYVLKLLDSPSDRNIVQIYNADQTKLYATILAIPDYRLKPADKTVITFAERASNAPPAIQAWFYPGDNFGQEFVYPKTRAAQLAKLENRPVPAMPNELTPNTTQPAKSAQEPQVQAMKKAPLKAEQPSGQETEIAQSFTPPPPSTPSQSKSQPATQAQPNATQLSPASSQVPVTLPRTASPLPALALLGLLLIAAALTIRLGARRIN